MKKNPYTEIDYFMFNAPKKYSRIVESKWIKVDGIMLYIRYGSRYINQVLTHDVITLSSIQVLIDSEIGKGKFTKLLEYIEREYITNVIYVESVMHRRFKNFFIRRGYIQLNQNADFVLYGI